MQVKLKGTRELTMVIHWFQILLLFISSLSVILQNDLEEFFAMVNFTNPGILGDATHFRRYYEVIYLLNILNKFGFQVR